MKYDAWLAFKNKKEEDCIAKFNKLAADIYEARNRRVPRSAAAVVADQRYQECVEGRRRAEDFVPDVIEGSTEDKKTDTVKEEPALVPDGNPDVAMVGPVTISTFAAFSAIMILS